MSYNQPSRGDRHVDRPLTSISIAHLQSLTGFVADQFAPVIPVSSKSDEYFVFDKADLTRDDAKERAPGAESAGTNYSLSTDNYNAKVYALHIDVADQIRANTDSPLNTDREVTEILARRMMIRKERIWASKQFVSGVWGTDLTGVDSAAPTAGQFGRWDRADSQPIEDIRSASTAMQIASAGFRPNTLVLGREVYDKLLDHPDIVGRLDRGQTTGAAIVMRQNLAALFEVDRVLVMDAIYNSAAEGQAASLGLIGGRSALLAYVAPSPGLMVPSASYTFSWSGLLGAGALGARMKRLRMEHLESDRLEQQMSFDQKLIATDLGYFFETAVN